MRVVLTGATGFLGRHLLFEFIKRNLRFLPRLQFIVLGRSKAGQSLRDRMTEIILTDGADYTGLKGDSAERLRDLCERNLHCIEADLELEGLGISEPDIQLLDSGPIDYLFHCAAMPDLRNTPAVEAALENTNVRGAERLMSLAAELDVREVCYIGSAYACGTACGVIQPDCADFTQEFRNPYERTKLEAEAFIQQFEIATGVRCRYFRPTVICGRLIEPPFGSVSKFDVLYGWGAFFLQLKAQMLRAGQDLYATPCLLPIRMVANPRGGLNIVPVDFVAKAIYEICASRDDSRSYHIANKVETPHELYASMILRTLNIKGCTYVKSIPTDQTPLERLYYKTVGAVFTPYVRSEPMLFDTTSLDAALESANLTCPPIDEENLRILIDYAKRHHFGLDLSKPAGKVLKTPSRPSAGRAGAGHVAVQSGG